MLIGSGFIGLEMASALSIRGLAVDVVAPKLPLSHIVGDRIALWLKARHEKKNVTFHLGVTAERITGSAAGRRSCFPTAAPCRETWSCSVSAFSLPWSTLRGATS